MTDVKGYKATLYNGRPMFGNRAKPYGVGRTYTYKGTLRLCNRGLHLCDHLVHVYVTYDVSYWTRVFEVTALGEVVSGLHKMCTDKLRFDRELSPDEIVDGLCDHDRVKVAVCYNGMVMATMIRSVLDNADGTSDSTLSRTRLRWLQRRRLEFLEALAGRTDQAVVRQAFRWMPRDTPERLETKLVLLRAASGKQGAKNTGGDAKEEGNAL